MVISIGKGNWMDDFEEFRIECDNKRNGRDK